MSEPEGPWIEPGEAPLGLLLAAPGEPGPDFLDQQLPAALGTGAVMAFLLEPGGPDGEAVRERCRALGVACLVVDDLPLARGLGADGAHLGDPALVAEARRRLGPGAIIGAACGRSRHLAMVAGEEGADYVLFDPGDAPADELEELCRWWTELFVLPCAVDLRRTELAPEPLIGAGADFIAVRNAVWSHPAGAAAAALDLRARIEGARAQRQVT